MGTKKENENVLNKGRQERDGAEEEREKSPNFLSFILFYMQMYTC